MEGDAGPGSTGERSGVDGGDGGDSGDSGESDSDPTVDTDPETAGVDVRSMALPVGAVARRLGVATSTLRTWDRRYGLGPHSHTEGSHRRYTEEDVARLALMRHLVVQGVAPGEAARVAVGTPSEQLLAGRATPAGAGDDTGDSGQDGAPGRYVGLTLVGGRPLASVATAQDAVDDLAAEFTTALDPSHRVSTQARQLARSVLDMDAPAITALVTDSVHRQGVVASWESLFAPALRAIGRRWALSGGGIEVEHLFSECLLTALRERALEVGGEPVNLAPVLLSCAEDEQHSLPLYALAAALAERRVGSRVLGARVPPAALTAAVRRTAPSVVFVWAQAPPTGGWPGPADLAPLPPVVLGGPGWDAANLPAGALHVAEFPRAVDLMVALAQ